MNNIHFVIYDGISTTPRLDPNHELPYARLVSFSKTFPLGLYLGMTIFLPRDISTSTWWRAGDKIVARDGFKIVWEGKIAGMAYTVNQGEIGIELTCVGLYGDLFGRTTTNKRWSDNRYSSDIWVQNTTKRGAELATYDRRDRLRITPKEVAWPIGNASIDYAMPTGRTVKRVTFNYDFSEDGEFPLQYAKWNNDPGITNTFDDMDEAIDSDPDTDYVVTITSDDYVYVAMRSLVAWSGVRVTMGTTVNAVAATLSCEYWKGATDTAAATWSSLSITDGTASGGATLAQDGDITFTPPLDWERTTVDSNSGYWLRFQTSANLTASIDITELAIIDIQDWSLVVYDVDNAAAIYTLSATGSGSQDLAAPGDFTATQNIEFRLVSNVAQTPRADGSYYAEISSVFVYDEVDSAITAGVICTDLAAEVSNISTYTYFIGDPSLTLEPFFTVGMESIASIIERSVLFGDSSFNPWYAQLIDSEKASTPDGKPVMVVAQYPDLTDYDYEIKLDDDNLVSQIKIVRHDSGVVNWVALQYRDAENNKDVLLTPDDNANLKDDDSITKYGERHFEQPINIGSATTTMALNIGRRLLAEYKDAKFYVEQPITVLGYVRGKNGVEIPASHIEAGKRVKIETYIEDVVGIVGVGFTQIITDTVYQEGRDGELCRINLSGTPDNLSIMLAQRSLNVD